MNEANLNERLEKLRAAGWRLRRVYTLRRLEGEESQSYYGDDLEAVVRRAEASDNEAPRRPKSRPKQEKAPQLELPEGWIQLAPVHIRPGESRYGAEKLFPGDGKPVLQSSASEAGLRRACVSYDAHKAGDKDVEIDEAMARRLASSKVHTGLSNTVNTPY